MVALRSTGDGNCLFNSASILLVGNESLSLELRLRTVIELATNVEYYSSHPHFQKKLKTYGGKSDFTMEGLYYVAAFTRESEAANDRKGFTEGIKKEITITSANRRYAGTLQICALASVIGFQIKMVYPDKALQILPMFHGTINPRVACNHNHEAKSILWTNTNGWDRKELFHSNHFVPVIKNENWRSIVKMSLGQHNFPTTSTSSNKRKFPVSSDDEVLPLAMGKDWFTKVGRNDISNKKRDESRKCKNIILYKTENKLMTAHLKAPVCKHF